MATTPTPLEQMGVAEVVTWLRGLKLPASAATAEANDVDGYVLSDMLTHRTLGAALGVTDALHQCKIRGAVAKLLQSQRAAAAAAAAAGRKRAAETASTEIPRVIDATPAGETAAANRIKRFRLDSTPRPEAAANPEGPITIMSGDRVIPTATMLTANDVIAIGRSVSGAVSVSVEHGPLCYVDPPHVELECALCLEAVPNDPARLANNACDHVFCKACLLKALRRTRQCPICRTAAGGGAGADVDSLVRHARLVGSMVDTLMVHCPNGCTESRSADQEPWSASTWRLMPGRCTATVLRQELAQHLRECEWAEVPCPCSELGCTARPARCKLAEHTATCWYNQGRPQLEAWTEKFQSISDKLSKMEAQLLEKQSAADDKQVKTDARLAATEISVSVLQQHNARLGLLARQLVRERSGGDPTSHFAGALRQLPEPDIARCKDFVQRTDGMTWMENQDSTVSIIVGGRHSYHMVAVPSMRLCELATLLPLCPTLTSFKTHCNIAAGCKTGWLKLALALPQCVLLEKLSLEGSKFDSWTVEDKRAGIVPTLGQCRSLTNLNLSGCKFNAHSTESVVTELRQCTGLQCLHLSMIRLGMGTVRMLAPALPVHLTQLYMNSCQSCDLAAADRATWCEVLCAALSKQSQLKTLQLESTLCFGDTQRNDAGAFASLAEVDPQTHTGDMARWYCSSQLGVDANGRCGSGTFTGPQCPSCSRLQTAADMAATMKSISSGRAKLSAMLHECKALNELNLGACELSSASATVLAKALPHSPQLELLELYENELSDIGCVNIANVLPQCPSLTHLDVGENKVGDEGALALATALPGCAKLTCLQASSNQIGMEGMIALANALEPSKLTNLCLRSNSMVRDDAIQFGQALLTQMRQLPDARKLDIDVSGTGLSSDENDEDAEHVLQELFDLCKTRPKLSVECEADDY